MNFSIKFILILALVFLVAESKKSRKSLKSKTLKAVSCDHPVQIINWGKNSPLYVQKVVESDGNKQGDVAVDTKSNENTKWCILPDKRIQNIETGLYLNVHGPGKFCSSRDTCGFYCQIDAYYTQGTSWEWDDVPYLGYHSLRTIDNTRALTVQSDGSLYLDPVVGNEPNTYQLFTFFPV